MPRRDVPANLPSPPHLQEAVKIPGIDFRIVTALYGGGAERSADEEDPFRVPSIRGHLRFWWRATAGGRFPFVEDLRKAEGRIWGDTDQRSKVAIRVLDAKRGTERSAAGQGRDGRWEKMEPNYALFPAQEDRRRIGKLYLDGRFQVELEISPKTTEEEEREIDNAIWAWVMFGGIGGRTRRGAGALFSPQFPFSWRPHAFKGSGETKTWPILKGGCVVTGPEALEWQACWKKSIELLRNFRQDRFLPRGRSRWPEPDTIRELRKIHASHHTPMGNERSFPRAELGLPIIFHFKTPGDPEANTLNVVGEDGKESRMASPVILKPWAISEGKAIPLLLVLNAHQPPEESLVLRQARPKATDLRGGTDFRRSHGVIEKLIQRAESDWATTRRLL